MKIFENKRLFKKLIIVFVLITIVSFCIPKGVRAEDENGGVLIKPIVSLFLSIGDGLMQIAHSVVVNQSETLIILEGDSDTLAWVAGIVLGVTVAILICITAGAAIPALVAAAPGVITAVAVVTGVGVGYAAGAYVDGNWLDDDLKLPIFTLTPEAIFSNEIPAFDVDFFNPMKDKTVVTKVQKYVEGTKTEYANVTFAGNDISVDVTATTAMLFENRDRVSQASLHTEEVEIGLKVCKYIVENEDVTIWVDKDGKGNTTTIKDEDKEIAYDPNATSDYMCVYINLEKDGIKYQIIRSKPENFEYIKGGTTLIFKKYDEYEKLSDDEKKNYIPVKYSSTGDNIKEEKVIKSTASQLREVISSWYVILRNIALVALLSILVYIGIRIIISSTSADQAKYKQMLGDWVIAICLLFVMHYIMSFSNLLVGKITDLLRTADYPSYIVVLDPEQTKEAVEIIDNADVEVREVLSNLGILGKDYLNWNTNLMGIIRVEAQFSKSGKMIYAGYMVMYLMLVLFTIYFIFVYLKRVIYMAFLTLMAPLVAMTYPIDKINDGKAQAFDMWLKEYIFNLLIQPLHLVLYTILVSSAIDLAKTNILYSIVAIAFMIPAEKILRRFFGFEKAQTPGLLGGAAGAALAWSGINKIMSHRPSKSGGHHEKNSGHENEDKSSINFANNFDKEEDALNFASVKNIDEEKTESKTESKTEQKTEPKTESLYDKNNEEDPSLTDYNKNMHPGKSDDTSSTKQNISSVPRSGRLKKVLGPQLTKGRYYRRNLKNKALKSLKNARPLRTVGRVAAGTIGAATFATAGGIIGLTSGDPSKVLQYTSAGAMGGYNMLKNVPENIKSTLSVDYSDEERKAIERAKYDSDEEYQEAQKKEYVKKLKSDSEFIAKMENKIGRERTEEVLNTGFVDDFVNDGITDSNDILAGYMMVNGLDYEGAVPVSLETAKSTIQYKNYIGSDTTNMDPDKKDKWKKTISTKLSKNKRAINNNLDTNGAAIRIIDNVDRLNDILNK